MTDSIDRFFAEWGGQQASLPPLDPDMQYIYRIARVSRILGDRLDATCARLGLTRSQFEAMAVLRRRAPEALSAQDLMAASFLSSGSVTAMLKQLIDRGLVQRATDPQDGRRIRVWLSERGVEVIEVAVRERASDNAELARLLPPPARQHMNTLMREFLTALEAIEDTA